MKKTIILLLAILTMIIAAGCGKTKILHCDNCSKEISVEQDSNMEEDWTIYCDECNEKLFKDNSILNDYDN